MARSLIHVQKQIARVQTREKKMLRGSIVGRSLRVPQSETFNDALSLEGAAQAARYKRFGQLAVVYLFKDEMRQELGRSYFNTLQVARAIDAAPKSARHPVTISRTELSLSKQPFRTADDGTLSYWIWSRVLSISASGRRIKPTALHTEELAIANHLFGEDNEETADTPIWLGALNVPDAGAAVDALEVIEDSMPTEFQADPVALIRRVD